VVDKGPAAALYMALVRSLIISALARASHSGVDPARLLTEVHETIRLQSSSVTFLTLFLGVVDPVKHTLTYANAGHPPPILRREFGDTELLAATGPALAVFDDLEWRDETVRLGTGDAVIMCTDGVGDARNPSMEMYGNHRLMSAVAVAPRGAGELLGYIEADLNAFTGGAAQPDDVAWLVLTRD
jgi:sigma-B regulation protein RsbU (phosphoserine phosphatase)